MKRPNRPIMTVGEKGRSKMAKKKAKLGLTRIRNKQYNVFVDAKRVTALRLAAGLTKTNAAKSIGWKVQKWHDFERARNPNPRIGTLLLVCKALRCEVQDLLRP